MGYGGHRSSRLLYHAPVNSRTWDYVNYFEYKNVRMTAPPDPDKLEYTIYVNASGCQEGYEPYKVFNHEVDQNGWLTPVGGLESSWISVNLPAWFNRPLNPNPHYKEKKASGGYIYHQVHCPPITLLEVWNPGDSTKAAKKFLLQARYEGDTDWVTIRTCEIKNHSSRYKSSFPITYKDENGEPYNDYTEIPKYDEFRILITECYGVEQVGFSRIDLCALVDHGELTFGTVGWTEESGARYRFPQYFEKFFMEDDDNDGVIWERLHDTSEMILGVCRWYPGHYDAVNYTHATIYPRDPGGIYLSRATGIGYADDVGPTFSRSANYGLFRRYSGKVETTSNGIEWTNPQTPPNWRQFASFSHDVDEGITAGYGNDPYAYRLEIDSSGMIRTIGKVRISNDDLNSSKTSFYLSGGGVIGCNKISEMLNVDVPNKDKTYGFANYEGRVYSSPIHMYYEFLDHDKVVERQCSWKFDYINSQFIVYGIHAYQTYRDPIDKKDKTLSRFTVGTSTDGFKSVTWHVIEDPVVGMPDNHFSSYNISGFDGGFILTEYGKNTNGLWKRDLFASTGEGNYGELLRKIHIPFAGYAHDPLYDNLLLTFGNYKLTQEDEAEQSFKLHSYSGMPDFNYFLYFSKGHVADPSGLLIMPNGLKQHWWSSNSYRTGGFIFYDGNNMAVNAGDMFCADNETTTRVDEYWRY